MQTKSARVPKELGAMRLDLVLVQLFHEMSRKKIKQIIDLGGAYVNKKRVFIASHVVKIGDLLEIFWGETAGGSLKQEDILFEDKGFLVLNKPAGIPAQATLSSSQFNILKELNKLDKERFKLDQLFLVHRLDKDTSGVMIVARNKAFQKKFEDLFRDRKVKKTYDALCFYCPNPAEGEISYPIAKDMTRNNCYIAIRKKPQTTNGTKQQQRNNDQKEALTNYKVVKNFKNESSHVACFPVTGRTHQVRVHLSAIGCPIIGDKTYAQNIYGNQFAQVALRHMLHARHTAFELDGKPYQFEAPWPQDFLDVIAKLEKAT